LARKIIFCDDGCFDGECVEGEPQTCYDTDGGIAYNTYGEIFLNEELVGIDNCKDGEADSISRGSATYLWENYWDESCNQQYELYECPYRCEAGACVSCYPIGFIESGQYCSSEGIMINQSEPDAFCENNFECNSNLCIDNKCLSGTVWSKFVRWLVRIFG